MHGLKVTYVMYRISLQNLIANQDIPCFIQPRKFTAIFPKFCLHWATLMSAHLAPCLIKTRFNTHTVLVPLPKSPIWFLPLKFSDQNSTFISPPWYRYMSRPSHRPRFHHSSNLMWRVQITRIHFTKFSLALNENLNNLNKRILSNFDKSVSDCIASRHRR
jgi:hypothetical protein